MYKNRVMPCLLLKDEALVKSIKFKQYQYIGDPINAVRIYNDMEVDELIFLDISATPNKKPPLIKLVSQIAGECFMPLTYGGGISNINDMRELFRVGVEKIAINTGAYVNPELISEASSLFGSQSIIVAMDVKKNFLGKYEVYVECGKRKTGIDPIVYAQNAEKHGAGEILVTSIDRDGTWDGYDFELCKKVAASVSIPVIAHGGAGSLEDIKNVIKLSACSAAAIGSMAVFQAKNMGVLIKFPKRKDIEQILV